ncbi:MAG: cytochrome b/b6 domain-containing protein [Acidobacteria bacterium]|nr:cytochrome b/b6 domain-containing protein [Acidobacteriota bacterium]MSO61005.1 cytochrome b/b6 domain-containing protein [Acidobacteriota bacterium]
MGNLVSWARSPWGDSVLTHISWDLFWASLIGGLLFLVAHGGYMLFSQHHKRDSSEVDRMEADRKGLPANVLRHGFVARMFHWVMAFSMLTLLLTAFLPIVGVQFAWVQWHWMAGILLTASIMFHIVHATFVLDFWSIWVGPKDIPEFKAEMMREVGIDAPGPKPGKYPLGNRLYHLAVVVAGLSVIVTGILMMWRVRTGLVERNPYMLTDSTWGITYVVHGLMGVGFVGLVIAHIYFALRPEKLWVTKSMIFGTITRRQYLEHHDPDRWVAESKSGSNVG